MASRNIIGVGYSTFGAKKAFDFLQHAFSKAHIFQKFDLDQYIETDMSNYAIVRILSQLTLNDLSQWYLVALYLYKIILAKTQYKTYNNDLLAIMELFKI